MESRSQGGSEPPGNKVLGEPKASEPAGALIRPGGRLSGQVREEAPRGRPRGSAQCPVCSALTSAVALCVEVALTSHQAIPDHTENPCKC